MEIHGGQEEEVTLQVYGRKELYSRKSSASFALVASVICKRAMSMSKYSNTEYADMHLM